MNKIPLSWLIPLAMILLASGFYIHNYVTFVHTPPALTDKEKHMVDTLFATTQTQCVGRYIFEVPASFENTLTDRAEINEVTISSRRLYPPAFAQRIRLREQALKDSYTVDAIDRPFLKQVYRLSENAVIFDRNRNESAAGFGRVLEGHLYVNGVAFIMSSEIRDVSDPKYKQDRAEYTNGGMAENQLNTKPQKLAELRDLMSRLSGRKNNEVPTQPGTCISEGFIRDGNGQAEENITFIYPHNQVFSFAVWSNNALKESSSMMERSHEIQSYLTGIRAQTLRKGKTKIAGFDTSEWLNTAPSKQYPESPSAQLLFTAVANEKTADFRHPNLDLTLSNHALPPPSYSDAELVEIWDRITRSFRLRNNAF